MSTILDALKKVEQQRRTQPGDGLPPSSGVSGPAQNKKTAPVWRRPAAVAIAAGVVCLMVIGGAYWMVFHTDDPAPDVSNTPPRQQPIASTNAASQQPAASIKASSQKSATQKEVTPQRPADVDNSRPQPPAMAKAVIAKTPPARVAQAPISQKSGPQPKKEAGGKPSEVPATLQSAPAKPAASAALEKAPLQTAAKPNLNQAPPSDETLPEPSPAKAAVTPPVSPTQPDSAVAKVSPAPAPMPAQEAKVSEKEQAAKIPLLKDPKIALQALAWSEFPEKRMAVINGLVLRQGDQVGQYTVGRIEQDQVVLVKGGKEAALSISRKR